MKSVVGALRVNLGLDSAQFKKGLGDAQAGLKRAGAQMRRIGAGLSVAVTAPLVLAGRDALRLAKIQENAQATVVQAIKSTEGAAGLAADELFSMASALQDVTKFGDEDILGNVTSQLLTFTNVTGDEFARAQQAILDISTVMKTDLKSTAIQVGKALNDPVKGLTALSRTGIQFTEDQKAVIESLVEAGDVAAAQGVILDELSKQFGGQAAAAAETLDGKITQMANSWGDLKEEFGAILAEFLPPLIDALRDVIKWVQELDPQTKEMAAKIGLVAAAIGPAVTALGLMTAAVVAIGAPVAAAIAGIGALTAGVVAFWPEITAAAEAVQDFAGRVLTYLSELPGEIVAIFATIPAQMAEIGREILQGLLNGLREKYDDVIGGIGGLAGNMVDKVKGVFKTRSPSRVFYDIGVDVMDGLRLGLRDAGEQVQSTMEGVTGTLQSEVQGLFQGILFEGESFRDALSSLLDSLSGRLFSNVTAGLTDAIFGRIPGFAGGTNYAPGGLALVGERGPELVNLPRGAQVIPNNRLGGMGSTFNQNLTLNVQGGGDPRAQAEAIRRVVRDETLAVLARSRREGR